jgi:glycosyltransferase involved in cell wall biosynthesis
MKFLLCCEFFHPSVGGVQEVMKQIATRLAAKNHDVTVATTKLDHRKTSNLGKVKIQSFEVSGNWVNGLNGKEISDYQNFVVDGEFDIIFIYAAQQWTFDALIEKFDEIQAKKIFVPCGFSGLYEPSYAEYFKKIPDVLKSLDALIFHANEYRDFELARAHGIENCHLIPNGADEYEFDQIPVPNFRNKNNITKDTSLLLTVGTLNGAKGHLEVAQALSKLEYEHPATLILNGNKMPSANNSGALKKLKNKLFSLSLKSFVHLLKLFIIRLLIVLRIRETYFSKLNRLTQEVNAGKYGKNKKIISCDLDREQLLNCYFESDLFVFASHIEYSPLVLFEACAAGLPFLSAPVGNAEEIARWTNGGVIYPAKKDFKGFTETDTNILAKEIDALIKNKTNLEQLSKNARQSWEKNYTWAKLFDQYEEVFLQHLD